MSISLLPPTSTIQGIQQPSANDYRQKLNDLLRAGPSGIMRRKEPDRHPSDLPRAPQAFTPPNPSPSTSLKPQAPGTDAPEEQASTAPSTAPNTDVEPQAPGADAPRLAQLRALASRESITQMLREPNSQETAQKLAEIRSLLSKENVKSMLQGPDADEARKLITEVKERLGQSSLQKIHDQSSHIERPGLSPQEIRDRTASSDPEESFSQSMQVFDELRVEESYAKQRVRQSTPLASALFEIGKEVDLGEPTPQPDNSSAEADSLKPDNNNSNSNSNSNSNDSRIDIGQTFTFHSTRDSNFDAPKEVMDFDHNRDKLDVTAIRNQLGNKPLKLVENFSGASGEVQVHYNPANNTSVVMISGNPGEPPFVVKVFGEVRYSNLTT
ncbi:M10 family metallopeptidase C-terminal domain-containing protein [Pseudomonas sp. Root569]|uniref:M10 family metallopeptidase C-terminal domain-containing protein n=1 Tax=Pseudomonas sp. Root569 TaxID=1736566 RepID=UPI0009E689BB|nr:M10 family metallopeptidase C-terminal domain-containing protein [Pseudomonas sp. Root569]